MIIKQYVSIFRIKKIALTNIYKHIPKYVNRVNKVTKKYLNQ